MPGQYIQPHAPCQDPPRDVQVALLIVSVILLRGDRRLVTGKGGQHEIQHQGGGHSGLAAEGLQQVGVQAVCQRQGR